jgi:hypothetical protein
MYIFYFILILYFKRPGMWRVCFTITFYTEIHYCNFSMENVACKTACTKVLPGNEHKIFDTFRRQEELN